MRPRHPWNRVLPVLSRVIFVDWHGVLSEARFWASIREHPALTSSLDFERALTSIFSSDAVDDWMRGHLTTRDVITSFLVPGHDPDLVRFLERVVIEECAGSATCRRLMRTLKALKEGHHLVLATDNMDCFSAALPKRQDLRSVFDDYITSSEVGVLKAEDPHRFFLPWLDDHDVPVGASLLIDDRPKNCERFCEIGGQAIVFDASPEMWSRLEALAASHPTEGPPSA